jgi:hypothetical protein
MWAKVGRALPYVILYIAAVAIVGLFNILTIDYRDNILTSAEFWNRVISQNLANLLILIATVSMYIVKFTETDTEFTSLKGTVNTAVRSDLDSEFGTWVFHRNKQEKIAAYRAKIQSKISKEELKANPKDIEVWYFGSDADKKKNRYCRRRINLEESIKVDRLDKLIMALRVDYDVIDRSFIETGEVIKSEKKLARQDTLGRKVKDNYAQFLFAVGGAAFFNAFIYTADLMDAAFWFKLATSLFLLIGMFLNGREYARNYVKKVMIVDLNTRYNVIKDYLTHKVKEKK